MWYIIKIVGGTCEIVTEADLTSPAGEILAQWGPFADRSAAIAKRVGLIRAGKCQPI